MAHQLTELNEKNDLITVSRELESGNRESVNRLRDLCKKQIALGKNIILDFENVDICPSIVWGNLIVVAKVAKENDLKVVICNLQPTVYKAAKIIGMTKYVFMVETLAKAESFLGVEVQDE